MSTPICESYLDISPQGEFTTPEDWTMDQLTTALLADGLRPMARLSRERRCFEVFGFVHHGMAEVGVNEHGVAYARGGGVYLDARNGDESDILDIVPGQDLVLLDLIRTKMDRNLAVTQHAGRGAVLDSLEVPCPTITAPLRCA
jgi:hypothetical protein